MNYKENVFKLIVKNVRMFGGLRNMEMETNFEEWDAGDLVHMMRDIHEFLIKKKEWDEFLEYIDRKYPADV